MGLDGNKVRSIYTTLQKGGYTQDYGTFLKGFTGADHYANRKKVYDLLAANGADVGGTYEEFMRRLWVEDAPTAAKAAAPNQAGGGTGVSVGTGGKRAGTAQTSAERAAAARTALEGAARGDTAVMPGMEGFFGKNAYGMPTVGAGADSSNGGKKGTEAAPEDPYAPKAEDYPATKAGQMAWLEDYKNYALDDLRKQRERINRRFERRRREEKKPTQKAFEKMMAKSAGVPYEVPAVPAPPSSGMELPGDGGEQFRFTEDPEWYGITVDPKTGKRKSQWLLGDGSITDDYMLAANMKWQARQNREYYRLAEEAAHAEDANWQLRKVEEDKADLRNKIARLKSRISEAGGNAGTSIQLQGDAWSAGIPADGGNSALVARLKNDLGQLETALRQLDQREHSVRQQLRRDKSKDSRWTFGADVWGPAFVHDLLHAGWDFGLGDFSDQRRIAAAQRRISEGRGSSADEALVRQQRERLTVSATFDRNAGAWERAFGIAAQSAPFMLDFVATGGGMGMIKGMTSAAVRGGVTSAGKGLAKAGMRSAGERLAGALEWLAKEGTKRHMFVHALGVTADDAVRASLMVNTIQAAKTQAEVLRRMNEEGMSYGDAMMVTQIDSTIENISELFGVHLEGFVRKMIRKGLGSALGRQVAGMADALGNIGVVNRASRWGHWMSEKAGYNGYLGEVAEEYYGQLLRTGVDIDTAYNGEGENSFTDPEWHRDIWLGMALGAPVSAGMGGGLQMASRAGNYLWYKRAVSRADEAASRAFVDKERWEALRDRINNTKVSETGSLFDKLFRRGGELQDLSAKERSAVLEYLTAKTSQRADNLRQIVTVREQNTVAGRSIAEQDRAFMQGYRSALSGDKQQWIAMAATQRWAAEDLVEMLGMEEGGDLLSALAERYGSADVVDMIDEAEKRSKKPGAGTEESEILDRLTKWARATNAMRGLEFGMQDYNDRVNETQQRINDNIVNASRGDVVEISWEETDGEGKPVRRSGFLVGGSLIENPANGGYRVYSESGDIVVADEKGGRMMTSVNGLKDLRVEGVSAAVEPVDAQEMTRNAMTGISEMSGFVEEGDEYFVTDEEGKPVQVTVKSRTRDGGWLINVEYADGASFEMEVSGEDIENDIVNFATLDARDEVDMSEWEERWEREASQGAAEAAAPDQDGGVKAGNSPAAPSTPSTPTAPSAPAVPSSAAESQQVDLFKVGDRFAMKLGEDIVEAEVVDVDDMGNVTVQMQTGEGPLVQQFAPDALSQLVEEASSTAAEAAAPGQEAGTEESGVDILAEEEVYRHTPEEVWAALVEACGGNVGIARQIAESNANDHRTEVEKETKKAPNFKGMTTQQKIEAMSAREALIAGHENAAEFWRDVIATGETPASSLNSDKKADAPGSEAEASPTAGEAATPNQDGGRTGGATAATGGTTAEAGAGTTSGTETSDEADEEIEAGVVSDEVRDKWQSARKVVGLGNEITVGGRKLKGHYVLVEAGAATPSHDWRNGWRKSKGYPQTKNGDSINDRNYERDRNAQAHTENDARNYDGRAYSSDVVVTRDGVVLSGNGRTMAGEIAARNGTDTAHNEYLAEYGKRFGFSREQVEEFEHPRVLFELEDDLPYTTKTMSDFNQTQQKGQAREDLVEKYGKMVSDDALSRINRIISDFETMDEFYRNEKAVMEVLRILQGAHIIEERKTNEMWEGESISDEGRNLIEATLLGKVFSANLDTARQLMRMPAQRNAVLKALPVLVANFALGDEFSFAREFTKAVQLVAEGIQGSYRYGSRVSEQVLETAMFGGDEAELSGIALNTEGMREFAIMFLADMINHRRSSLLAEVLGRYNELAAASASGQAELFSEGVPSRSEMVGRWKEALRLMESDRRREFEERQAERERERKTGKKSNEQYKPNYDVDYYEKIEQSAPASESDGGGGERTDGEDFGRGPQHSGESETEEETGASSLNGGKKADAAGTGTGSLNDGERGEDEGDGATFLDVVRTLYEKGKEFASGLFQMKFFDVVGTPRFMKELGLTGNKFTIRYGVIARHFGKDSSHDLEVDVWKQLPEALQRPFAITRIDEEGRSAGRKGESFRLYTTLRNNKGEYVVVGVDVKNAGRDMEVNAISTIFGRRRGAGVTVREVVIYTDKEITPEQLALLNRPNSDQYPASRENSEDKVSDLSSDKQEDGEKSSEEGAESEDFGHGPQHSGGTEAGTAEEDERKRRDDEEEREKQEAERKHKDEERKREADKARREARLRELMERELTEGEIDSAEGFDETIKNLAKGFLRGKKSALSTVAYNKIKEDVRNKQLESEGDSEVADGTHVGGTPDDAVSGGTGRGSGEGGGLDSEDDGEGGAERGPRGEDSAGVVASAAGAGGAVAVAGEAPGGESVDTGDGERRGGDRVGGSDVRDSGGESGGGEDAGDDGLHGGGAAGDLGAEGTASGTASGTRASSLNSDKNSDAPGAGTGAEAAAPDQDAPTAAKAAAPDQAGGKRGERTGRGERTAEDVDRDLKDALGELGDILKGIGKGRANDITTVIAELIVKAPQLITAGCKVGYFLLERGFRQFKKWHARFKEVAGDKFRDAGLSDEVIDQLIEEFWNSPFAIDGEILTIAEWAEEMTREELRRAVSKSIGEKIEEQRKAEGIDVKIGDLANIRETLPFLLPQQHEDVEKAERQFFDPSHADREHGFGKGYMFTNGTGTGKTFTGLGIVKRFLKQGKGRVLIVTASEKKINDWISDAKKLGIEASMLEDTKTKGRGVVVTQYANMRQNDAILEDEFDLIVYDESHKLMENQTGSATATSEAHFLVSNRDVRSAITRSFRQHPVFQELRWKMSLLEDLQEISLRPKSELSERLKAIARNYRSEAELNNAVETTSLEIERLSEELERLIDEAMQNPEKVAAAEKAVARTKVVFLSATPFNTPRNLEYVEGYIFSYEGAGEGSGDFGHSPQHGAEAGGTGASSLNSDKNGDGTERRDEAGKERDRLRNNFLMRNFPSSHTYDKKGNVVRMADARIADAEKAGEEEVAFSDRLQNETETMSGRIIDSMYDYSREFPVMDTPIMPCFNQAISEIDNGKYSPLKEFFGHFFNDYNTMTAYMEAIKTSMVIDRVMEHIRLGRKVAVYHRRKSIKEDLTPPFDRGIRGVMSSDNARAKQLAAKFVQEFPDLFQWEQTVDFRLPVDQILSKLATEEDKRKFEEETIKWEGDVREAQAKKRKRIPKRPRLKVSGVGVFNGDIDIKEKEAYVDSFNDDDSDLNILVCQVASAKEGISLHDTTGKHQRVMVNLFLPQSPIEFIQTEGRIYRIGNRSDAIFEYPILGFNIELWSFINKINGRSQTSENLALGSMSRGLRNSIAASVRARRRIPVTENMGKGGKLLDSSANQNETDYDGAIKNYQEWKGAGTAGASSLNSDKKADASGAAGVGGDFGHSPQHGADAGGDGVEIPDPIGYVMVALGSANTGEHAVVPFASTGTIARYVPNSVRLTALEGDMGKFVDLAALVSGNGRTVLDTSLEKWHVSNKCDVIVMNAPHSRVRPEGNLSDVCQDEENIIRAFSHLEEGGRVVAIVARENMAEVERFVDNTNAAVMREVIAMPAFVLNGRESRIVVIDRISNEDLANEAKRYDSGQEKRDFSKAKTEDELFKAMRDVAGLKRFIDVKAKVRKRAQSGLNKAKTLPTVASRRDYSSGKMQPEVNDGVNSLHIGFKKGHFRVPERLLSDGAISRYYEYFSINYAKVANGDARYIMELCQNWVTYDQWANLKDDEDVKRLRLVDYRFTTPDKLGKTAEEVRATAKMLRDLIGNVLGKNEIQIRNMAKGVSENAIYGELSFKQYSEALRSLTGGNAEFEELNEKVLEAVGRIEGIQFRAKPGSSFGPGVLAHYNPFNNSIEINEGIFNSATVNDDMKRQTLLHEMIHAVTSYAMRIYESGRTDLLTQEQIEACQDIFEVYRQINNSEFAAQLQLKARGDANATYGLTSAYEMMAELSNPIFRSALKAKSLWRQLVNGIRRLLGMDVTGEGEESTALDVLNDALERLLSNFNGNAYREYLAAAQRQQGGTMEADEDWLRIETDEMMVGESRDFDAVRERAVAGRGIVMPGLNEAEVRVVEVSRHDFTGTSKEALQAAEKWAKENIVGVHTATDMFGEEFRYSISNDAVEKYVSPSATRKSANIGVHLAALKRLPDIVSESIDAEIHADYKKHYGERTAQSDINEASLVHRFYGAVRIEGSLYRVKTTMREYSDANMLTVAHSYEVTQIELLEVPSDNTMSTAEPVAMTSDSSITGTKLLKGVEKSYDKGKYLLEESEKSEDLTNDSDKGNNPRFREGGRRGGNGVGLTVDERKAAAERVAERVAGPLGVRVRVVAASDIEGEDELSRRKREAKGWFDVESGEIVVVADNHVNGADVEATVLHEVVGHKALREMIGDERFGEFLDGVYSRASKRIRREIDRRVNRALGTDGDVGSRLITVKKGEGNPGAEEMTEARREAVEEYIAELAERGFAEFDGEEKSFWRQVIGWIRGLMARMGLPISRIGDNQLRYMLWRSYQKLRGESGYVGAVRDAEMRRRSGVVRFRSASPVTRASTHATRAIVRARYDEMIRSAAYQVREAMQDSQLGLRRLMEQIAGNGTHVADIAGFENAYLYENRMGSTNLAEQHEYLNRFAKPLISAVDELLKGVKGRKAKKRAYRELTEYMIAKHGLERNLKFAERDANAAVAADATGKTTFDDAYDKFRKRDYSGLTALTGQKDVEAAELAAQDMVDSYESSHDTSELWSRVKMASTASLEKTYRSGWISEDSFNEISAMFDYYIPLQGWDEKTSDEEYAYLHAFDSRFTGKPIRHAEGRRSLADDPLATLLRNADEAIRLGNRNIMKQRFLNFVLNHPSDAVAVNKVWFVHSDITGEWEPIFADLEENDTHDEVERKIRDFEKTMEANAAAEPDKYKRGRDAVRFPMIVKKTNRNEHQVIVRRNGESYVITILGNPRAAQCLNGETNPDSPTGGYGAVLNFIKRGTRWLSANFTTRNPDFIIGNFFRDLQFTATTVWAKEGGKYGAKYLGNLAKYNPGHMARLFNKWRKGTLGTSGTEGLFRLFMTNGGETGYTNVRDLDSYKSEIMKELKTKGRASAFLKLLLAYFDVAGRAVENSARFATFVTSMRSGRSLDRSIWDAKEVSVNFNKKGTGGRMHDKAGATWQGRTAGIVTDILGTTSVFFNAGIQGMTTTARVTKKHPVAMAFTAAGMMAIGFAVSMIGQMFGGSGDDDEEEIDYLNLPEYVRRQNVCLKFPGSDSWITVPISIEHRALYGLGDMLALAFTGRERKEGSELLATIAAQLSQTLPIDFMEGGEFSWRSFVPSVVRPFADMAVNQSWTGLPIYKDTPFNKDTPEWTKAYSNADHNIVSITRWLNEATGGDDVKSGWLDLNPSMIEYGLNGFIGGPMTFGSRLLKTVETAVGAREHDWRNYPLVNRLVKSGDERMAEKRLNNEWFRVFDEYKKTKRVVDGYNDKIDNGYIEYAERFDLLTNSKAFKRYEILEDEGYVSEMESIAKEMKECETEEEYQELKEESQELKREALARIKEI